MWCRHARTRARTTLATAMKALHTWPRGCVNPCSRTNPSRGPTPDALASCSFPAASCPLLPPPAAPHMTRALPPHSPLHLRRLAAAPTSASNNSSHRARDTSAAATATTTTAAAANTSAASAATSAATAAALALRFRTGRQRMTPLERAAAAAHDALTEAATTAAAAAARTPRSAVIAAAAARRSGAAGGGGPQRSGRAAQPSFLEEEQEEEVAVDVDVEAEEERQQAEEQRRRFVGQLQCVPHVISSLEHLGSARKRASKVTPSAGIKNEAERERSRAARRLDTLMKELSVPLGRYLAGFPAPARLHPFEGALLALTVGEGAYTAALQRVDKLRRAVQEVGKGAAGRAAQAPNKAAATALSEEGAEAIEAVFSAGARHVDALKEIAKKLRSLPSLDTSLPTLALVGAPNVGKSSLVNILSSGTPEVCNYPFTTRSIKMGHFYLDSQKHQVTDTPGLLRRPDVERNRMEQLTLAALGCLDTAVLFVLDLTEECGTSVDDQWAIRQEVRARFPDRPWIDVLSKADMLQDVFAAADDLSTRGRPDAAAAAEATKATTTATAVAQPAGAGGRSGEGQAGEEAGEGVGALSAVEVAARMPTAVRISSLTHDGIPQLQLAIIGMLRAQAQARREQQQLQQLRQQQQQQQALQQPLQYQPPPQEQQQQQATGKAPLLTFFSQ
ncbi:hypothetical protein PLESTB_000774700 [Pleodorina starrii]|uniref:Uncharacterized protein n=1 Tax=Pleodorina starrii TaxID=330485 RepID=A0A9W6F2R9_9CHLO|nr:hypothetical protein PLESTM_000430600 [Pleodorina starrii]GLC53670.1 hypothetical protein PLESTB_000774700 [Pleodorina starrii]GLC70185.1 hypothetical protein PLESTF_000935300 [Pleodorina starrii]GLC77542.1 hypothetical protein PLESTF_001952800 [Pleodorina starrii]